MITGPESVETGEFLKVSSGEVSHVSYQASLPVRGD
jgi:hypothetical protein